MKRLLIVAPEFHPDTTGYANACTAMVIALSRAGAGQIIVITPTPCESSRELDLPRVEVHRTPRVHLHVPGLDAAGVGTELALYREVRRLVRATSVDWVLFETAEFPLAGLLTLHHVGIERVAVRVHAASETEWVLYRRDIGYRLKRLPTRLFFRRIRYILSTTSHYLTWVRRRFLDDDALLVASKRYAVVPNIVLTTDESAPRLASPANTVELLTLGRIDRDGELQKNFSRLIMALALVVPHPDRPVRLRIVGDGNFRPTLERLVHRLELAECVTFDRRLSLAEVHGLQRGADAVVLASTFEGQSMFALESLRNGAPLLVARSGGLTDLVEDGVNGLTFDPLDVDDIAATIQRFVDEFAHDVPRLRRASSDRFERFFQEDAVTAGLLRVLRTFEAERGLGR